ncbi:MAG: FtsL-like putative cell division protein [Bacteroidota bacterium]
MSENKLKETPVEEAAEQEAPKPRRRRANRGWLRFMNVFEWFDRDQVVHNMPFILFLTGLVMCYIANSYYSERIIRDIDKAKTDLRERSAEFISTRSQMMFESKQSEVAKSAAPLGLTESKEPPEKLVVERSDEEKQP